MTEDDTFHALRKASFEDIRAYVNSISFETLDEIIKSDESREEFLRSHGWTLAEFKSYLDTHYD